MSRVLVALVVVLLLVGADGARAQAQGASLAKLPDGVQRPILQPVSTPILPGRFCSEFERNAYLEQVYNPAVATANANAQAAVGYQGQVSGLADQYMRKEGGGAVWGVLLAEHKAYQPVMDQALAQGREMGPLYPKILAIPVAGDCVKTAQQAPAAPATRLADAPAPVKQAASNTIAKPDCPPKTGRKPIVVGPNGRIGSGARLKSKAASTALGLAGNLLGGSPLGGGGGGGGGGPPMVNCRIKDSEMTIFRDPATGTALKVGAKRAKDTLIVFAKIDASSDSGTFQTAFLQKPDGAVLAPSDVGICDLWGEWKLTVSWTRDTYVDNELVKHEQGGWSEGGRFALPGLVSTTERPDGLWRRLGFSNAGHGARMVALQYKVPAKDLAQTPMDLVIHVTRPAQDPVTTVPFAMTLSEGVSGFDLVQARGDACPPGLPGTVIADGAGGRGGGLINASNPSPGAPANAPREAPRMEPTLVDLRADAEVIRARTAQIGGSDTMEGARRNAQSAIDVEDERLRRLDEAIAALGGTITDMEDWYRREDARSVHTKEDAINNHLDPVQNTEETGIEVGLLLLGQPELTPLVAVLDASQVWVQKIEKERALARWKQMVADQKLKLTDFYRLRAEVSQRRSRAFAKLQQIRQGQRDYAAKEQEVFDEERRLGVNQPPPPPPRRAAADADTTRGTDARGDDALRSEANRNSVRPAAPSPAPH